MGVGPKPFSLKTTFMEYVHAVVMMSMVVKEEVHILPTTGSILKETRSMGYLPYMAYV